MTDLPPVPYPTGSWRATRRPLRAVSQSPTRRLGDDLLARISPRTAADLLRYPTGPIKTCLEAAAVSDQAFALRAAVASKKIQDWLDEISEWNWPTAGGSAGFEMPRAKRRKLSFTQHSPVSITVSSGTDSNLNSDAHDGADDNTTYIGSLPAHQVAAYERRVAEIDVEMKDLDLDEIKRHVLHNHIMPLSRPGTPFADTRSNASTMAFVRMDDLTAVITAIVIQALPNLSRLSKLMDTWSTRLSVLHRLPTFLGALEGAEVALRSAYNAIGIATGDGQGSDTLSREDFTIMKNVLLPRVTKAARELDCMLDSLEGMEDTLPDEWLDRMEAVEKGSGEWIAACERKIREAEWAKILEVTRNTFKAPRTTSSATTIAVSERESSSPKSISRPKSAAASDVPGIEVSATSPTQSIEHFVEDSFTSDILNFDGELSSLMEEEDEDQLPPLGSRRDSMASQQSPTTRRNLGPFSSNRFARELSPELPRLRDTEETFTSDALSPPNSPPVKKSKRSASVTFKEVATVAPAPEYDETPPRTPLEPDFIEETPLVVGPRKAPEENPDDQLQLQISEILESIPAKITLAPEPASAATLNPPDLPIQRMKQRKGVDNTTSSSGRTTSSLSSRAGTPSFTLSPAYTRNPRPSRQRSKQDIKLYHLSRSTGEAPIKLFIRCVGERGERVMVRVGGGWADLGEYLKEYAAHHRRQGASDRANVEVRGINASSLGAHTPTPSSPPSRPSSRPTSALGPSSPMTPLVIRKTRRSVGALDGLPRTPLAQNTGEGNTPPSSGAESCRSRSSSRLSWNEEDSSLGLAGPTGKQVEMSEESKAWIESVKKKVRIASGGHQLGASMPSGSLSPDPTLQDGRCSGQDTRDNRRSNAHPPRSKSAMDGRFGEMGKVGSTKRLFRKNLQ